MDDQHLYVGAVQMFHRQLSMKKVDTMAVKIVTMRFTILFFVAGFIFVKIKIKNFFAGLCPANLFAEQALL